MPRTATRLAAFAVILAALFTGGWAVGEQFPTDPADHTSDHTSDEHGTDSGAGDGHATGDHSDEEVAP